MCKKEYNAVKCSVIKNSVLRRFSGVEVMLVTIRKEVVEIRKKTFDEALVTRLVKKNSSSA